MGEREKLNTYLSGDIGNYGRERNLSGDIGNYGRERCEFK
jgi:hypothetical protein